jgi:hydroxylamine reductase
MTSNCIIDPTVGAYDDRIWTRSIVGWPGVSHLEGDDFAPVIAQAQQMAGFPYSEIEHLITVGFGRETLLGAADSLIDLVSREKLRHIFLIGGCDGARGERNYFTDFATSVPEDCLILTLAAVNTASTNWTSAISKACRVWSMPVSVTMLTRPLFWRSPWRKNWAVA